jgi:hypothetical protein
MKTMHAGLLGGLGWVTQVLAVLLLLSATLPVLGKNRQPLDLTQPCVVIRRKGKFIGSVSEAAAAGYRITAVNPWMLFMAREASPPDTYRYLQAWGWPPGSFTKRLNQLGALGYRYRWDGIFEKSPHPQNWHYEEMPLKRIGKTAYLEFPGQGYQYAGASGESLESMKVLFEKRGELHANEKAFPGGEVLSVPQRDVPGDLSRGYRYLTSVRTPRLKILLEKPSSREKHYDRRLIPGSEDTAVIEARLNAAGKKGFRLSGGGWFSPESLEVQKPAEGTRFRYSYRITREFKGRSLYHQAAAATCQDGYYPIGVSLRGRYGSYRYRIYLEKKSAPQVGAQQGNTASTEQKAGKPGAASGQSGLTVLAKDTPVEIELLTDISSRSPGPRTPVQFKVVRPVRVNGKTVIASGNPVQGMAVTKAAARGHKPGSVALTDLRTTTTDGSNVLLRFARSSAQTVRPRGEETGSVNDYTTAFLSLGFPISWPFIKMRKGKNVIIPAGERFEVYVVKAVSYTR